MDSKANIGVDKVGFGFSYFKLYPDSDFNFIHQVRVRVGLHEKTLKEVN